MNNASRTPRKYEHTIDVRFGDIDAYGHVNSNFYLDYVTTSRMMFQKNVLDLSDQFFIDHKIGFFVSRFEINYKRPIVGVQTIFVTSHAVEVEGSRLKVAFQILSQDKAKLYSDGYMFLACIDLQTNRPQNFPEWGHQYLYE